MTKKTKNSGSASRARTGSGVCRALLCLLFCISSVSSFAHQQKTAVTRILFNSSTGNIEVMHRFLLHDAEHAAGVVFGAAQDLLGSAGSRALFGSYVVNRFAIEALDGSGQNIDFELDYVGEEIDGQFLWVYQETRQPSGIKAVRVVNLALRDVWPDQTNLVNIEKDGQLYSLSFVEATESQLVEF